RRAGLEPAGDDGYFQTASFKGAKVRNVAAILRGSDHKLNSTWLMVSAHYDHLGTQGKGPAKRIYNGANDDASGTSSMLTLAEAFVRMKERPKRSLLFIAYYGEEKGLLGSHYYASHPLAPLARTVADLNLEHMGRTDDTEGPSLRRLSVTGFDYSNLTAWLQAAGQDTGVTIYRHAKDSDPFFARSDNQALADAGVPAHTLVAAYIFPDYHQPGDHWEKLDYENMASVTRTVAVALSRLANSAQAVEWNADNPQAAKYVQAAKALNAAQ
ncbi:MAG: M28 family peptidase, partial [Bryobacteraceae bacterium]